MVLADLMYGDPGAIQRFLGRRRAHKNLFSGIWRFLRWGAVEPLRAASYALPHKIFAAPRALLAVATTASRRRAVACRHGGRTLAVSTAAILEPLAASAEVASFDALVEAVTHDRDSAGRGRHDRERRRRLRRTRQRDPFRSGDRAGRRRPSPIGRPLCSSSRPTRCIAPRRGRTSPRTRCSMWRLEMTRALLLALVVLPSLASSASAQVLAGTGDAMGVAMPDAAPAPAAPAVPGILLRHFPSTLDGLNLTGESAEIRWPIYLTACAGRRRFAPAHRLQLGRLDPARCLDVDRADQRSPDRDRRDRCAARASDCRFRGAGRSCRARLQRDLDLGSAAPPRRLLGCGDLRALDAD